MTLLRNPPLARLCRVALGALLLAGVAHSAEPVPARTPHEWVVDTAHALKSSDRQQLADMLSQYHRETHHQIAVLTVPTTGDEPIERFSLRTANAWALGYPGLNNGILVTLAIKDGRVRIDLGTGMERYISNADAKAIVDTDLAPAFASGDIAGGLRRGLKKLMAKARAFVVKPIDPPPAAGQAPH